MSNLDLTKILSKKYKELPERKKVQGQAFKPGGDFLGFQYNFNTNNLWDYTFFFFDKFCFSPCRRNMYTISLKKRKLLSLTC